MNKKSDYLHIIYDNVTFTTLQDAIKFINTKDKQHADVLETGENQPTFFTGELIIYEINKNKYSGVVLDIYIKHKSIVYLILKRLGISQLHDIIKIENNKDNGMEVIFDRYAGGAHMIDSSELDFVDMMNILTYHTSNANEEIYEIIHGALEHHDDMLDALDEVTDPEVPVTIH